MVAFEKFQHEFEYKYKENLNQSIFASSVLQFLEFRESANSSNAQQQQKFLTQNSAKSADEQMSEKLLQSKQDYSALKSEIKSLLKDFQEQLKQHIKLIPSQ